MTMKITAATRALTALAQETRLGIVRLLVKVGPSGLVAGQIALRLKLAPATSSFHLSQLTQAGLIKPSREGRSIRYSPVLSTIGELLAFLDENLSGGPTEKAAAKASAKSTPKPTANSTTKAAPAKKKAARKSR
ncbi:ArsR/SmtB family transcription factor [Acidiferrobacter thiooxydans]|jgi:DNA-binding transcriptional ArsR family regulator|nr:helix-turn-helix transcriptional regulator [Acidiferrobacter thiooxydans]MDA8191671.1 helix-turn-helix transcriptional regulator [Gammaproteobacteria bacterium]UEN98447.1 ArsR family transcriptional regulator [Acidiferrobacter thiooxydans]